MRRAARPPGQRFGGRVAEEGWGEMFPRAAPSAGSGEWRWPGWAPAEGAARWAGVPAGSRHRPPPAPSQRAPRGAGCPVLEGARRAGGGDAGRAAWRADPDRPPAPHPGGTRLPRLALGAGCLWGQPLRAPLPAPGVPLRGVPAGGGCPRM